MGHKHTCSHCEIGLWCSYGQRAAFGLVTTHLFFFLFRSFVRKPVERQSNWLLAQFRLMLAAQTSWLDNWYTADVCSICRVQHASLSTISELPATHVARINSIRRIACQKMNVNSICSIYYYYSYRFHWMLGSMRVGAEHLTTLPWHIQNEINTLSGLSIHINWIYV